MPVYDHAKLTEENNRTVLQIVIMIGDRIPSY